MLTGTQAGGFHRRLEEQDSIRVWLSQSLLGPAAAVPVLAAAGEAGRSRTTPAIESRRRPRVRARDLLAAGDWGEREGEDALAAVEVR